MKLTRLISRHRRLLAAACAAAAVASALAAVRPASSGGVRVLAAARDLPSGVTLRLSDVRRVVLPAAAVPAGALRSIPTGRELAAPVRKGEPLTDVRLVGTGLLGGYGPDLVAVPVRMADAGAVRLLHPGDRIDVLAAATGDGDLSTGATDKPPRQTRPVVSSVPVIAVPRESDGETVSPSGGPGDGALVVLAARRDQAATLAAFTGDSRLTFAIVE